MTLTDKERKRLSDLLKKRGTSKRNGIMIPTIAQGVGIVVGGAMVAGADALTELGRLNFPQAIRNFQNHASRNKKMVAMGIGIMAAPTIVRRLFGLRKSSTRLAKVGPVAIDVI